MVFKSDFITPPECTAPVFYMAKVSSFPHSWEPYRRSPFGRNNTFHVIKGRKVIMCFNFVDLEDPLQCLDERCLEGFGHGFGVRLLYGDDKRVVDAKECERAILQDATRPSVEELSKTTYMIEGRVTVVLDSIMLLSSQTTPQHRCMCLQIYPLDPKLRLLPSMTATSTNFYVISKSNVSHRKKVRELAGYGENENVVLDSSSASSFEE